MLGDKVVLDVGYLIAIYLSGRGEYSVRAV